MMRDLDAGYAELMDELEEAVDEMDAAERGARFQVRSARIEDLLRRQMGLNARLQPSDRRSGPTALN